MSKSYGLKRTKTGSLGIPVEKLDQTLTAKVGSQLKKRVENAAKGEGKAVSEWIRDSILYKLKV